MVTVFIDGFFEEPALLSGLYQLRVDQHEGISKRNARIAQVQQLNAKQKFTNLEKFLKNVPLFSPLTNFESNSVVYP